ncbi:hypothetical protein THRCLA_05752, partial [Thraustotheca clavata]
MLVYAKARYPNEAFRPWFMMPYMMLIYSFTCSVLTLYIVENRLRRRKSKWVVPVLSAGMMLIVCAGIALFYYPSTFSVLSQSTPIAKTNVSIPPEKALDRPNMSQPPRKEEPTLAKLLAAADDWKPNPGYVDLEQDSPFGYYEYAYELNPEKLDNLIMN